MKWIDKSCRPHREHTYLVAQLIICCISWGIPFMQFLNFGLFVLCIHEYVILKQKPEHFFVYSFLWEVCHKLCPVWLFSLHFLCCLSCGMYMHLLQPFISLLFHSFFFNVTPLKSSKTEMQIQVSILYYVISSMCLQANKNYIYLVKFRFCIMSFPVHVYKQTKTTYLGFLFIHTILNLIFFIWSVCCQPTKNPIKCLNIAKLLVKYHFLFKWRKIKYLFPVKITILHILFQTCWWPNLGGNFDILQWLALFYF